MNIFRRLRNSLIFLLVSVCCIIIFYLSEKFNFSNLVESTTLDQLRAQKPLSISKKAYYAGDYKIQLYGWTFQDPAPMDGADQRIRIKNIKASLDGKPLDVKEDKSNEIKKIWTITVPSSGMLNVIIENYETPVGDFFGGTIYLECQTPWIRIFSFILLIILFFSGMIGVFLFVFDSIKIFRDLLR
jgi:hypothetical protein